MTLAQEESKHGKYRALLGQGRRHTRARSGVTCVVCKRFIIKRRKEVYPSRGCTACHYINRNP